MAGKCIDIKDDLSTKIRNMYLDGKRVYEIREELNGVILDDGIVKRLKRMGLYKKRVQRVHYDMDVLLNLHRNVDGCYLLGLLLADGSMTIIKTTDEGRDLKKISLEIERKDEDSLVKLRDHFISDAKLSYRTKRNLVSLSFNNTDSCNYLETMGVSINKRRVEMPKLPDTLFESKDLALAFLAGYNDGDGCISVYEDKRSLCGSKGIKFNITAATPVWKELYKVFDYLGLTYSTTTTKPTYVSCCFTDIENTIKVLMDAYTKTNLVFSRRKNKLRDTCQAVLESPIRYKKYGNSIIHHDTTGYFTRNTEVTL